MKRLIVLILFIGLGSLSAQSFVKHFNVVQDELQLRNTADTLKILAVMVEFQPDKYDGTIGTGKFGSHYTQAYGDTILDPLPHDANYFSDHLEFAKNYFKKVANGKVNISYNIIPNIITVSKYIRDYVPDYKSKDLARLGNFAKEVWQLTDQLNSTIKFSDYDLFIIFHAGVSSGLDIGTFSIDRNMPSLYLSTKSLKEIFGNQFNGFPANKNSSLIKNSIILPETESRELTAIDDSIRLLEITINGALVSNIASHLGLPDLYNTETGTSAIGRFGLMDGQAIIANFGMFPPEPSPWEKMYLGWEVPTTISVGNKRVNLSSRVSSTITDTTLIKIPINSSEYFLIENRSQDARKDKVKITYKRAGKTFTKIVEPDASGYFYIDYSSIDGGVVIDVDEYDAAIPGNGIVIWHIDEKIINQKISSNTINSDLFKKGVDVEEADGIQDIGEIFNSILGTAIGEGGFEDFWFKGNISKLYKNRFSYDTKPNSNSNDDSRNLITFENFSEKSNKMNFDLKFGDGSLELISRTKFDFSNINRMISARNYSTTPFIYVVENSILHKIDLSGKLIKSIPNFSQIQPIVFDYNSTEYVIGAYGTVINIYSKNTTEDKFKVVLTTAAQITALSFDPNINSKPNILIGANIAYGKAIRIPFEDLLNTTQLNLNSNVIYESEYLPIKNFAIGNDYITILDQKELIEFIPSSNSKKVTWFDYGSAKKSVLVKGNDGKNYSVVLLSENYFSVVSNGIILNTFLVNSSITINSFAVGDIYNDGKYYIVVSNGEEIVAYNFNGAIAENFPIRLPNEIKFNQSILILDYNKDNSTDIICFDDMGKIYFIDPKKGTLNNILTLSSGNRISSNPIIVSEELPTMGPLPSYKPYLVVFNDDNQLSIWKLANMQGANNWVNLFGDSHNLSFVKSNLQSSTPTEFFPAEKAYSWPNPVYVNQTNIRYFVSENSDVVIKIFDLSGKMIAELKNRAIGGFDNETVWDISNVASGVYYTYLEIKSDLGKTASKIIKIAVIK